MNENFYKALNNVCSQISFSLKAKAHFENEYSNVQNEPNQKQV